MVWCVPSTVSGQATCTTNNGTAELLPSYPRLPFSASFSADANDLRGWIYFPVMERNPCSNHLDVLFRDVAALSNCTAEGWCSLPEAVSEIASFLTETSTSHETVGDTATVSPSSRQPSSFISTTPTDIFSIPIDISGIMTAVLAVTQPLLAPAFRLPS